MGRIEKKLSIHKILWSIKKKKDEKLIQIFVTFYVDITFRKKRRRKIAQPFILITHITYFLKQIYNVTNLHYLSFLIFFNKNRKIRKKEKKANKIFISSLSDFINNFASLLWTKGFLVSKGPCTSSLHPPPRRLLTLSFSLSFSLDRDLRAIKRVWRWRS